MSRSDIRAGGAYVELLLKDAAFTKGLRSARQRLQNFGSGAAALSGAISSAGSVFGAFGGELSKSAKLLTGLSGGVFIAINAIEGLSGALTVLGKSPALMVITGLTAAAGAAAVAYQTLTTHTAKVTDEMNLLRAAGDKQRESDQQALARLQELAAQNGLTNAELIEAESIVSKLQRAYGDLGLSVNRATGSIEGMTEAQDKLNEAQRKSAAAELKREEAEIASNITELTKELEDASTAWASFWSASNDVSNERAANVIRQKIAAQWAARDAVRARRSELEAGDMSALTGEGGRKAPGDERPTVPEGALPDDDAQFQQDLARLKAIWDERERLQAELEETQIETSLTGIEKARALLALEEKRRALEAQQAGLGTEEVKKIFDLKRQKLEQDEADRVRRESDMGAIEQDPEQMRGRVFSTFSSAAAAAAGRTGGGLGDPQLNETKKTNQKVDALVEISKGIVRAIQESWRTS